MREFAEALIAAIFLVVIVIWLVRIFIEVIYG
jgi:hypothetical protein